jgi:hypothetical protein
LFKELDTQANGEFVVPKVPAKEGSKSLTIFINVFAEFKCVNKQHIAIDPIVSLAWQSCTYSRSHQHKYDKLQQTHLLVKFSTTRYAEILYINLDLFSFSTRYTTKENAMSQICKIVHMK